MEGSGSAVDGAARLDFVSASSVSAGQQEEEGGGMEGEAERGALLFASHVCHIVATTLPFVMVVSG